MKPAVGILHLLFVLLAGIAMTTAARAQPTRGEVAPNLGQDVTINIDGQQKCPASKVASQLAEVLESALDAQGRVKPDVLAFVEITCNLTLPAGAVVTKSLFMTGPGASGVTIDCNGATIDGRHWMPNDTIVISGEQDASGTWHGAENITVRDCTVLGAIRVIGVAVGGTALKQLSYRPDYTQVMQAGGSRNIVFDRMKITAYGRNPFYIMPGVTRTTLRNSTVNGRSAGVAIYLDAESADNVIKDNDIGVTTDRREQLAIDGSARNLIVGNRFSGLNHGGIRIYRNCGERGVVRQQFPEDNVIIDNIFYYNRYRGDTQAIWIASRQNDLPGYCDEDEGSDVPNIGSSLDHLDHAYRTVVARNRFVARNPSELIRASDDPAYVFDNVRVAAASDRNSPCYVASGYPDPIVESGESIAMFDDGSGPRCTGRKLTCTDGIVSESAARCIRPTPNIGRQISVAPFDCGVEGNNAGCTGQASCPAGTILTAVKAACNLEFGAVSDAQLASTPWSLAGVVKRSDKVSDGRCTLGALDVSENGAILTGLSGTIDFSCREHDANGGDCQLRGALACQSTGPAAGGAGEFLLQ